MYELVQVGSGTYYIDCPAKIGVYLPRDGEAILIDSGNDKDAGKKALKVLESRGWALKAILNTHSHADHIGGNRYLQAQTGCAIFAPGIEVDFTRHPILEPAFLYGGFPSQDLRRKFLLAQESEVRELSDPFFPKEIEVIPLPGHSFDMVGYRTPDGVVFLADSLSSQAVLDKYGVPFIYDVGAYLRTLDAVVALKATMFVPAHADAAEDVRELVAYNRAKVYQIADQLLDICHAPASPEAILREVFIHYGLTMSFEQYVLVGSTVRSFLSWMKDEGRVSARFQDNGLLWEAAIRE